MSFAIPVVPKPKLPVQGSEAQFPVNNLYCVGRNYGEHAIEMGHDPDREPPFFFLKPAYAVLPGGGEMVYPSCTNDVHHEVELVVALKQGGSNITEVAAFDTIFGYGVGIDMTRRDLQAEAKQAARPWDAGKVFLHSAPCSGLFESDELLTDAEISLEVNGTVKQAGNVNQMIWKIPEIIARLSELFPLYPGDLIFTGTPAGVGPIKAGDRMKAAIKGVSELFVDVTGAEI